LTSNDAPLDSEILAIRDTILHASLEYHRTSNFFYEIKETFSYISDHFAELENFLRLHRSTLSPIRRLPGEILCEIFAFVTVPAFSLGRTEDDPREPPWTLGLVCKRWRDHAISYQSLW
ncbi:hypothetical protein DFH06DRAFT_952076, partial [Mycena polygramma]